MKATTFILASALCLLTSATPIKSASTITYFGSLTDLSVQNRESNTNVIDALYQGCSATDLASGTRITGGVCMAQLVSYMLQAMATVVDGSCTVAVVNSTTADVVTGTTSRKRHDGAIGDVRRALNGSWSGPGGSFGGAQVRVMDAGASHVHPSHGRAFRTNIHSDDATLFVHTNGRNATVRFDREPIASSRKRGTLDTSGYRFQFPMAQGVKMEAQGIHNSGTGDYLSDLVAFAYAFADGTGVSPVFQQGDSWKYTLCDATVKRPLFYGRVIAEAWEFESNYEPVSPLACG